ncbi:MAG: phosphoribosylglycinamide formyltransferase, partial [Anaerovoracaceae bacterium]
MKKIVVLVSGGGTNFQSIIDAIAEKKINNAEIVLLISSNSKAYAINRAEKAGIKTCIIPNSKGSNSSSKQLLNEIDKVAPDLIVLAGYLKIVPGELVKKYPNRIINIHPSLIPKHSGKGYYG